MSIHWLIPAASAGVGVILGALGDWQIGAKLRKRSELRALTKEYGSLSGTYLNHRVRDDGAHEPTCGTVELAWQPQDGLLEATAFQANGHPEWHSYIRMSKEYPGTGAGHFNTVNSIHGGIQQVIYSKQTRSFLVTGTNHNRKEFSYCWKRKE